MAKIRAHWSNWSGSVDAQPAEILEPRTEAELAAIVARSPKVRVVGAGHSFMPLCETPGTLFRLDDLEGRIEVAADRKSVRAPAGWSLKKLTKALWDEGLSLPNQGDVNPQSLAGAISTGTHGTGITLGSLATITRSFRLVLADGSITECSPAKNPELFEAQRLSLGLFGVVTQIEIDVLPAYHLEENIRVRTLAEVEEQWVALIEQHRHVEFWIFPYSDKVFLKTLDLCEPIAKQVDDKDLPQGIFQFCCDLGARFPATIPLLQRIMMRVSNDGHRAGPAYRVFPSERAVRFEEMEYEVPLANGFAALREAIARIRKERLPVTFPFEFRAVAADDIWMSPFNKGPCASISMHQYGKMPWQGVFGQVEPILRAHGGRPHWAKRHTLASQDVFALYPMAERFCAVREKTDPQAKFANAHLSALFGLPALS